MKQPYVWITLAVKGGRTSFTHLLGRITHGKDVLLAVCGVLIEHNLGIETHHCAGEGGGGVDKGNTIQREKWETRRSVPVHSPVSELIPDQLQSSAF